MATSPIRRRPSLHYPRQALHGYLQATADRTPERPALLFDDDVFTYRDMDAWGTCFSNALAQRGVGLRHRVLLAAANRPEWLMAQHGVSVAGAGTVLANSSWKGAELAHALTLTTPSAVVADAAQVAVLEACGVDLPAVRICLDDEAPAGWERFWDVVTTSSGRRPDDLDPELLATLEALLPFSSGTTGMPKAVRHSHASLVAASTQRLSAYALSDADRLQYFMPLFTIYGVIVAATAFAAGAPLRLFRRFDPEVALANMEAEHITVGFGAAPVAVALRDRPDLERFDLSSVRYLMWGATGILPDVAGAFTARTGVPWMGAYATTEVGITSNPAHRLADARLDTPGYPLSDVEIRIVELGTGIDVAPGEEGEIVVRSPGLMMGYLPPEDDADAFVDGRWFRTGDVGWLEPDGWLHITDRAKEMMKVRGFNVAPVEIERVLFEHPAVADCAVYGIRDARHGEVPKAAVVVAPGAVVTEDDLKAYVAERLATYKQLGRVAFVDVVPRNAGGKVLRRVLRDDDPEAGPAL